MDCVMRQVIVTKVTKLVFRAHHQNIMKNAKCLRAMANILAFNYHYISPVAGNLLLFITRLVFFEILLWSSVIEWTHYKIVGGNLC